jgi:hypothetical protein
VARSANRQDAIVEWCGHFGLHQLDEALERELEPDSAAWHERIEISETALDVA